MIFNLKGGQLKSHPRTRGYFQAALRPGVTKHTMLATKLSHIMKEQARKLRHFEIAPSQLVISIKQPVKLYVDTREYAKLHLEYHKNAETQVEFIVEISFIM